MTMTTQIIKDSYDLGKLQERRRIINIIQEWDVEPCCHGIRQEELIEKIKEEKK